MMSLEYLIITYGYPVLLIGTFFEGETILVLGGFIARLGYLKLPLVIFSAFFGSFAGDQIIFFIGRLKGKEFLGKRPSWNARVEKIRHLLERYQTPIILGFRFVYGFRTITPLAIGMSHVKTGTFILLNSLSAMIWAMAIGTGGYLFATALEALFGDIRRYEMKAIAGIGIIGMVIWLVHVYRKKHYRDKKIS